jgi:hypothetical protein
MCRANASVAHPPASCTPRPGFVQGGDSTNRHEVPWRPDVVRRGFPEIGPRLKWAPSPQALLYALHALPVRTVKNFGCAHVQGVWDRRSWQELDARH